MISRLFAPVSVARLFDPMPLPRNNRSRNSGKIRVGRNVIEFTQLSFSKSERRIR